MKLEPEQWLIDYVALWRDRLNIGREWTVVIKLSLAPDEDHTNYACCIRTPQIHHAEIVFRADITDTDEWRQCVVHELLHIKHCRIDEAVREIITPQLPNGMEKIADLTYKMAYEPFIDELATILYEMWRAKAKSPTRKAKLP